MSQRCWCESRRFTREPEISPRHSWRFHAASFSKSLLQSTHLGIYFDCTPSLRSNLFSYAESVLEGPRTPLPKTRQGLNSCVRGQLENCPEWQESRHINHTRLGGR